MPRIFFSQFIPSLCDHFSHGLGVGFVDQLGCHQGRRIGIGIRNRSLDVRVTQIAGRYQSLNCKSVRW